MAGGIRKKLHLRRFRPFRPKKESIQPEHSLIGGAGFLRVVYCNNTEIQNVLTYDNNYLRSAKVSVLHLDPLAFTFSAVKNPVLCYRKHRRSLIAW